MGRDKRESSPWKSLLVKNTNKGGEQSAMVKMFLRDVFKNYNISFSSSGSGFWIKYTGLDKSTEDLENRVLASPIIGNIRVSGITRDHFRTEMNPLVRSMRAQSEAFFADPRVQILYGFLLGGGGGGATSGFVSRGATAAARQLGVRAASTGFNAARSSLSIGGRAVVNNIVQSGARNILINTSVQTILSGGDFNNIDKADIAFSAISGNSYIFYGLSSALIDYRGNGLVTAADKSMYQTSVDAATSIAFGFTAGQAGSAIRSRGGADMVDFTINLYGGLFNWTLSPPSKPSKN